MLFAKGPVAHMVVTQTSKANLSEAVLVRAAGGPQLDRPGEADLWRANLSEPILTGVKFSATDLNGAERRSMP